MADHDARPERLRPVEPRRTSRTRIRLDVHLRRRLGTARNSPEVGVGQALPPVSVESPTRTSVALLGTKYRS